jgi:osmoprotectant transport system permease protein
MSFLRYAWTWLTSAAQWRNPYPIQVRVLEHLGYSGLSLLVAALIAVPLGVLIGHSGRGRFLVINLANVWRAIPTFGLLVLMAVLLGFSFLTWLIPLAAIAIPPILVNTCEGVAGVDADLKDAALGMGMTQWQLIRKVEIPLASPLIVLGLRTATIFVIATATIAADIGAGGLGRYIFDGLNSDNYGEVAGGAAVLVVLALASLLIFAGVRRLIVPAGLRAQASAFR